MLRLKLTRMRSAGDPPGISIKLERKPLEGRRPLRPKKQELQQNGDAEIKSDREFVSPDYPRESRVYYESPIDIRIPEQ